MFMYLFIRDFLCDFLYESLCEKQPITDIPPELHITTPLPELQKFFQKKKKKKKKKKKRPRRV